MADARLPRGHLDAIRRAYGFTWAELAAVSHCDTRRLRKLDTGRVDRVSLGLVMRVAVALGVRCVDVLPLLGAQPSRDCSASRFVATRAELHAVAGARVLAALGRDPDGRPPGGFAGRRPRRPSKANAPAAGAGAEGEQLGDAADQPEG